MDEQEIAVDHQQRGGDRENAAQFHEGSRGGDDADRPQHDRNLEQRLSEVEIGVALGGLVAFGLPFFGLGEKLRALPSPVAGSLS